MSNNNNNNHHFTRFDSSGFDYDNLDTTPTSEAGACEVDQELVHEFEDYYQNYSSPQSRIYTGDSVVPQLAFEDTYIASSSITGEEETFLVEGSLSPINFETLFPLSPPQECFNAPPSPPPLQQIIGLEDKINEQCYSPQNEMALNIESSEVFLDPQIEQFVEKSEESELFDENQENINPNNNDDINKTFTIPEMPFFKEEPRQYSEDLLKEIAKKEKRDIKGMDLTPEQHEKIKYYRKQMSNAKASKKKRDGTLQLLASLQRNSTTLTEEIKVLKQQVHEVEMENEKLRSIVKELKK